MSHVGLYGGARNEAVSFATYWIRTFARHAAASPPLRRALIGVLNRVPAVKGRIRRALAQANTLETQRVATTEDIAAEDMLLSRQARRTLALLREERRQHDARRDADVTRR